MTDKRPSLGRASLIYGLSSVLSRAASIIMLPLYTRLLTPADYGILQMLELTSDVVAVLLSAGATAGVMRFYFKTNSADERDRLLGTAFGMLLLLHLFGGGLIALGQPQIRDAMLGPSATPTMVYIAAANFFLGSISVVPMLSFQMAEQAMRFASLSLLRLILQLSLNILMLTVFKQGPLGILLSSFITNIVFGLATVVIFLRGRKLAYGWDDVKRLRAFARPYQLTTAGAMILTFGDRIFLKKYFDVGTVGIYALAYQFGFLLASVSSAPILRAWTPQRHQQSTLPREERDKLYNQGLLLLTVVTLGGAVAASLFALPVLRVMADPAFHAAAAIVPLTVFAYVLQAWSDSFMFNFDVAERPSCISISTWITVVCCVALYALLIPRYGAMGAAVATVLAFIIRLSIYWVWSNRVWPVTIDWMPHFSMVVAGTIATIGTRMLAPDALIPQFAVAGGFFLAFIIAAWISLPADAKPGVQAYLNRLLPAALRRS